MPSAGGVLTLLGAAALVPHLRLLEDVLPEGCTRRFRNDAAYGAILCAEIALPVLEETWRRMACGDVSDDSPEAYRMDVTPSGIVAAAATAEGLYRACATLRQGLKAGVPIPCGHVTDVPEKAVRGLMLDVSRNRVHGLPTLFRLVDRMAELKLNRLELYFENVFAYAAHPGVWAGTSPYTPNDLLALGAYCRERFVTLVPNQNTLGHFERWFLAESSLLRYAELPQGGARTPWGSVQTTPTGLCSGDSDTVAFASGLLNELLPCFPDARDANLGGDEVFDLGLGRSAGNGDKAALYLSYMARMAETARRHGKRPELWADMLLRHPDALARAGETLPAARWILWGYEASDPLADGARRLSETGLPFLVAPGTSSWRSFCGRTANMLANVRAAAAIACDGLLLTDWGDAGHWQPLAVSLPAIVFAASLAWNSAVEPDLSAAIDALAGIRGLGGFLLRLGDTYRIAKAEAGNATRLFQAYNVPLADAPAFDRAALLSARAELAALEEEAGALGDALPAQEARFALGLQTLAVERALGTPGLRRLRASLAARMRQLWLARGPVAGLEASLAAFLAPELPS